MEVTHEISIDLLKPRRNLIHVVQEDSTRKIRLTLLKDNLPYNVAADLPSGETLLTFVEFLKSDGHGGMYDTTSLGETAVALEDPLEAQNVWLVALDGQCFTAPGFAQINVRFETESGRRIHTFPIFVDVEATASSDTESTDWGELNSIADLRNAVSELAIIVENIAGNTGLTEDVKQALLDCIANVGWADNANGQGYYDALEAALYPPAELLSISAVFDQGDTVIYDTDSLNALKPMLTVTAHYSDGTTAIVSAYTLSGTLTEGESTITVNYGGKSDTFTVTVTEANPALYKWDFTQSLDDVKQGATATLGGGLTRDNNGISFTAVSQYIDLGAIFALGRSYEFDFTNFEFQQGAGYNKRLVMYGSDASTGNGVLIWRKSANNCWAMYNGAWSNAYGNITENAFANSTVRISVSSTGEVTLYLNGTYVGQSSKTVASGTYHLYIGNSGNLSNGGDIHNCTITGVRVYEGV